MTDEKFDSRVIASGKTEFVYGISWQNTSKESLLRDGRVELERPKSKNQFQQRANSQFDIQANNQTKLDLEDRAAAALKHRLSREQLCKNGYEISDVLWKDSSIRLLGFCL